MVNQNKIIIAGIAKAAEKMKKLNQPKFCATIPAVDEKTLLAKDEKEKSKAY